jgi:hypothetical protein
MWHESYSKVAANCFNFPCGRRERLFERCRGRLIVFAGIAGAVVAYVIGLWFDADWATRFLTPRRVAGRRAGSTPLRVADDAADLERNGAE